MRAAHLGVELIDQNFSVQLARRARRSRIGPQTARRRFRRRTGLGSPARTGDYHFAPPCPTAIVGVVDDHGRLRFYRQVDGTNACQSKRVEAGLARFERGGRGDEPSRTHPVSFANRDAFGKANAFGLSPTLQRCLKLLLIELLANFQGRQFGHVDEVGHGHPILMKSNFQRCIGGEVSERMSSRLARRTKHQPNSDADHAQC